MMKTPDEFRIPVETGKIPLELTAQMKWNIAETISRIHDNGIVLGAGDFVDVDDLKYICQATSYLLLYAQQLEAERDAAVNDLRYAVSHPHTAGVCYACKHHDDCKFQDDCDTVENNHWEWRGVQKEE